MVTADTRADDIEDALAETERSGLSLVLIIRSALIAVAIVLLLLTQGVPCGLFGAGIAFVFLGIEWQRRKFIRGAFCPRRIASMMFIDDVCFANLSQKMAAEEITAMLDTFSMKSGAPPWNTGAFSSA